MSSAKCQSVNVSFTVIHVTINNCDLTGIVQYVIILSICYCYCYAVTVDISYIILFVISLVH